MKSIRFSTAVLCLLALASAAPAVADDHEEAAKQVMARAYEQWAAFDGRDVAKAMSQVADDYTEFNRSLATRVEGKAMATRMAEATNQDTTETVLSEMLNPKVQVYGDVAILSYNYHGMTKNGDGVVEPFRAKSTRVYVKQGGQWMLVHSNFGADPLDD